MKKNIIKIKSFDFAIRIVNLSKFLNNKKEFVLSKQILRSGTSIGALIREAEHAESKPDFIHKMSIAQKEANETQYWLDLLFKTEYIDEAMFDSIICDVKELRKLIASIIISSKKNSG